VIFPSQEEPAADYAGKYCLTEFLEVKGAQRIQTGNLMPDWEPDTNDIHLDDGGNGKLRLYLPYLSFNPLMNIRISSELADTVIWEPPVANLKITAINGEPAGTQTDVFDLGVCADRTTVSVTVANLGNVASSGEIECQPIDTGASWAFEPQSQGTGTLQPEEEKTYTFDVVDLTTTEEGTYKFKVALYNILGVRTDFRDFQVTLLPRGVGGVLLYIRTFDANTTQDVAGHRVILSWNNQGSAQELVTPASYDFEGVTPLVTVTAPETADYQAASATLQLVVGLNRIDLELLPQGYVPPPDDYTWLIILILVAVMFAAMYWIYRKNSRAKSMRGGKSRRKSLFGGGRKW